MARALFTTEAGRNLLLRAARIKPGTAIMDSIWQDAGSKMLRLALSATAAAAASPKPSAADQSQ
jgi:hypothetical protein